jgi:hypothetical protein
MPFDRRDFFALADRHAVQRIEAPLQKDAANGKRWNRQNDAMTVGDAGSSTLRLIRGEA